MTLACRTPPPRAAGLEQFCLAETKDAPLLKEKTFVKKANLIIYGLFGAISLAYGVLNLLFPAFLVPETGQSFVLSHILREQAAAVLFIGLMFFWCIFNYERRTTVHYFLIVFAFLLAAIHWFDYLSGHLRWMAPLYNTVPLIVLVIMALGMRSVPGAVATGSR